MTIKVKTVKSLLELPPCTFKARQICGNINIGDRIPVYENRYGGCLVCIWLYQQPHTNPPNTLVFLELVQ